MARSPPRSGKKAAPAKATRNSKGAPPKSQKTADSWEEQKRKRAAGIKALKSLATLYKGRKESNAQYQADVAAYEAQQRALAERANAQQQQKPAATSRVPSANEAGGEDDGWVKPAELQKRLAASKVRSNVDECSVDKWYLPPTNCPRNRRSPRERTKYRAPVAGDIHPAIVPTNHRHLWQRAKDVNCIDKPIRGNWQAVVSLQEDND